MSTQDPNDGDVIAGPQLERARQLTLQMLENDLDIMQAAVKKADLADADERLMAAAIAIRLRPTLELFEVLGWPEPYESNTGRRIGSLMEALEKSLAENGRAY